MLAPVIDLVHSLEAKAIFGQVESVRGLTVRVKDFVAPVDSTVEIRTQRGVAIPGQVVGFERQCAVVMSLGALEGMASGDLVVATSTARSGLCATR